MEIKNLLKFTKAILDNYLYLQFWLFYIDTYRKFNQIQKRYLKMNQSNQIELIKR